MTSHDPGDRFLEPRYMESEAYAARAPRRLMEVLGPFVIRRIGGTELYRRRRKNLHKFGYRVFDAMTFLRLMVPSEEEIKRNPSSAEHWDRFFHDLGKDAKEHTERIIAFRNQSWIHPNSYDDKQVYDCLDDILGLLLAIRQAQEADPGMADVLPEVEAAIEQVRFMMNELGNLLAAGDFSAGLFKEKLDALLNPSSAASIRHDGENEIRGTWSPDVPATELADAGLELRVSLAHGSSYEHRKGQASALAEQARLATAKGDFDLAVANYEVVAAFYAEGRYNRDHAAALHGRGKTHTTKRRFDQATADFASARQLDPDLKLDPEDAAPYHHKANEKFFGGEYEEAIGLFEIVLSLNPDGAADYSVTRRTRRSTGSSGTYGGRFTPDRLWEIYHDRGRALLALENFDDSIADFDESDRRRGKPLEDNDYFRRVALCSIAIRNNPYDASAHVERARAYTDAREYDLALADLDRARLLDTSLDCRCEYWEVHVNRADDFLGAGQLVQAYDDGEGAGREFVELAIEGYTEALDIDANNASVLYDKGNAYFSIGEYRLAAKEYMAALHISPGRDGDYKDAWGRGYEFDSEVCLFDKGRALAALARTDSDDQGVLEQAIQDFRSVLSGELLKSWPECEHGDDIEMGVEVHTELALAHFAQGNFDSVISICSHAIAVAPGSLGWDRLWELRGKALFGKKDYRAAIRDLTHVIDGSPGYFTANLLRTRGQAHAALGDLYQAIEDYDGYMREYGRKGKVLRLREAAVRQLEASGSGGPSL